MRRRVWLYRIMFDRRFDSRMSNYVFQCGMATGSLVVILLVEDVVLRTAIVVAIASATFIIFVVPISTAATPRRVIGGHAVRMIVGSASARILASPGIEAAAEDSRVIVDVLAALSVGLSIFVMVVTGTEHPPAAGITLGLVIQGWSISPTVFILSGAILLSLVRLLLKPKSINLL